MFKYFVRRVDTMEQRKRIESRIPVKDMLAHMTKDLLNIGALVVRIENNLTDENNDLPPHSFRLTVVGGDKNRIAQCIYDNKPPGIRSFGDTSGVAIDEMIEFTGDRRVWFNHIEIDYISRAINFMEKWQPIVYDIEEKIECGD